MTPRRSCRARGQAFTRITSPGSPASNRRSANGRSSRAIETVAETPLRSPIGNLNEYPARSRYSANTAGSAAQSLSRIAGPKCRRSGGYGPTALAHVSGEANRAADAGSAASTSANTTAAINADPLTARSELDGPGLAAQRDRLIAVLRARRRPSEARLPRRLDRERLE